MTARADPLHTARDVESNIITCDTGLGSGPRAINADRGGLHRKLGRFWKSPLWSRRIGEKSSLIIAKNQAEAAAEGVPRHPRQAVRLDVTKSEEAFQETQQWATRPDGIRARELKEHWSTGAVELKSATQFDLYGMTFSKVLGDMPCKDKSAVLEAWWRNESAGLRERFSELARIEQKRNNDAWSRLLKDEMQKRSEETTCLLEDEKQERNEETTRLTEDEEAFSCNSSSTRSSPTPSRFPPEVPSHLTCSTTALCWQHADGL